MLFHILPKNTIVKIRLDASIQDIFLKKRVYMYILMTVASMSIDIHIHTYIKKYFNTFCLYRSSLSDALKGTTSQYYCFSISF